MLIPLSGSYSTSTAVALSALQQVSTAPPWWHSSEFHQPLRQLPRKFSVTPLRGSLANSAGSPADFPMNLTGDPEGSCWLVLLASQPTSSEFKNPPVYSFPVPFLESLPGAPGGGVLLSFRTPGADFPSGSIISTPDGSFPQVLLTPHKQMSHYLPEPMAPQ